MANIFSLYGSIFIDNEKANKSIDETTGKGKNASKSFSENLGNVVKSGLKIGTAIVGTATAVVGGFTAMANKTGEYAGSILDASRETSINTTLLQQLKFAGEQAGVSFENLTGGADKLNKKLAEAQTGNKKSAESFKNLGVAITDSSGKARSSSDVYDDVILKLASMGDSAESNALGNEIFGKSFSNLKPLLAEGKDGIEAFKTQAQELGIVMSEDSVIAGDTFSDTFATIKSALGGAFNKIMSSLMPVIQKVLDLIIKNMPTIQNMIDRLAPILISTLDEILPVFIQFAEQFLPIIFDLIEQLLPPISEIIKQLLPILSQLLEIILPPLMKIVEAVMPILLPLIEALMPLLEPLIDVLAWLIDNVLTPIIDVITKIIELLSKALAGAIKGITPIVQSMGDIFKKVFGTLWEIVKAPINFIIDGLNIFIKALNKIKVPDWVPGIGGKGINIKLIPKLAKGLDYVPYDEFPALLHKGERVLTARENKDYSNNQEKQLINNFNNTIQIENLEVRDENDINRIAEELYYLQQKKAVA